MAPIKIHDVTIDPEQPPEGSNLRDATNTNFVLVQTTHPLNRKEFAELEACGAQVLDLADANYTYRCRYEPHDLTTLERLDFVKHAIIYHQDFVLHTALKNVDQSNPASFLKPFGSPDTGDEFLCDVEIQLHEAVPPGGDPFLKRLSDKLHEEFPTMDTASHGNSLRLLLPVSSLKDVAAFDQVQSIRPAPKIGSTTRKARQVLGIDSWTTGLYPWYASSRFAAASNSSWDGTGQTVAIVDTGFNIGIGSTDEKTKLPAFEGRIANVNEKQRMRIKFVENGVQRYVTEEQTLEDQDEDSHGTHVAGCVVGNQWNTSWNPGRTQNPESYDMCGTAPGAQVYVQKFWRPANAEPRPGDFKTVYHPFETLTNAMASSKGAVKIHNYSNAATTGESEKSENWQDAYNTDMDIFTNLIAKDNLVVTSAGNSGDVMTFTDSVDAQKPERWSNRQIGYYNASKNSLVIGASWSTRIMDAYPHAAGAAADVVPRWDDSRTHEGDIGGMGLGKYGKCGKEAVNAICSFSSKGPTLEGYLKPDLVAPGVGILSAFSQHPAAQAKKRGKAAAESNLFSTVYEANYCFYKEMQFASGTSSAAPLVAGIAACVRQAALAKGATDFLAATVRAILINTAVSLAGNVFFYWVSDPTSTKPKRITAREARLREPPDCIQGFGLVNYRRSLIPILEAPKRLVTPSDTEGYGWTGYHQVAAGSQDCFTNTGQTWPRDGAFYSDDNLQTLSSCIYWKDPANKQLRVTLAYDDFAGNFLKHQLQLRVYQQIFESGTWSDVPHAAWDPDEIKDYDQMDTWRTGDDRKVQFGTVQKVTVTNVVWTPSQKMRFQMRITATAIFQDSGLLRDPKVGFSLCWLASPDAKF